LHLNTITNVCSSQRLFISYKNAAGGLDGISRSSFAWGENLRSSIRHTMRQAMLGALPVPMCYPLVQASTCGQALQQARRSTGMGMSMDWPGVLASSPRSSPGIAMLASVVDLNSFQSNVSRVHIASPSSRRCSSCRAFRACHNKETSHCHARPLLMHVRFPHGSSRRTK